MTSCTAWHICCSIRESSSMGNSLKVFAAQSASCFTLTATFTSVSTNSLLRRVSARWFTSTVPYTRVIGRRTAKTYRVECSTLTRAIFTWAISLTAKDQAEVDITTRLMRPSTTASGATITVKVKAPSLTLRGRSQVGSLERTKWKESWPTNGLWHLQRRKESLIWSSSTETNLSLLIRLVFSSKCKNSNRRRRSLVTQCEARIKSLARQLGLIESKSLGSENHFKQLHANKKQVLKL